MKEQFRRRRLPHLDKPGAIYFVTTCLEGSIPALGLLEISKYRQGLAKRDRPVEMTEERWRNYKWKMEFAKADQWLDRSLASKHLENEDLAEIAEQSLLHFAGVRFAIWAWVVMPNHVHCVFEPLHQWVESLGDKADERTPRERIMHSFKRHSARLCNRKLEITGSYWQDESYDHCVDDVDELERVIQYVERNPVKAGLATDASAYRFSSSKYRKEQGIPYGRPLIGGTQLNALG